ncbi:uncharacterized protein LOC144478119 [Augochlora pura]
MKSPATLVGIGEGRNQKIAYSVKMDLGIRDGDSPVMIASAYVLPKITGYVPPTITALENYDELLGLKLADPDPDHRIEVLLGAELYAEVNKKGVLRLGGTDPLAQETIFGWILSGPTRVPCQAHPKSRALHSCVLESLNKAIRSVGFFRSWDIDNKLLYLLLLNEGVFSCRIIIITESRGIYFQNNPYSRFWEVEEIPSASVLTEAEKECEGFYAKTVARDASGRFTVRLPLKIQRPDEALGESLHIALSALSRLRKKLDVNSALVQEYRGFLTEYESLGHMTRLKSIEKSRLYIPHRAVLRAESTTTKLRAVFNTSCRTAGGRSLNDILHVGPKLQTDITSVLTRWRLYEYVLVGGIEKMFRQILVAPEDRHLQCVTGLRTEQIGYGPTDSP